MGQLELSEQAIMHVTAASVHSLCFGGVLNGKLLSGVDVAPMPCQEMSMNALSLEGS